MVPAGQAERPGFTAGNRNTADESSANIMSNPRRPRKHKIKKKVLTVDCGTERTGFGAVTFAMRSWGRVVNGKGENILFPL